MAKLADRITEALKSYVEPGEELRAVGQATSGLLSTGAAGILITAGAALLVLLRPWWIGAAISVAGGAAYLLLVKSWWVGVTSRRVIFTQLTAFSRPNPNIHFALPLTEITLAGKGISVATTQQGVPPTFKYHFGAKRATGLDVAAFEAALTAGGTGQ